MSLCLSMIVKNEEHVIARCLRSVRPFIDSYSISDTGSTDNTIDIIREELAGIPGILTRDPWLGFGPSRNVPLRRATGTHVLSLDADEIIEHKGGPMQLSSQFDCFLVQQIQPPLTFWIHRIIRNDPRWSWKDRIHNYLDFDGTPTEGRVTNFQIRPFFDSHQNVSGNKYLGHLAHYESAEKTPRNVFYHARTLDDIGGREEEALKKYQERSTMGGWDEEVYLSLWMVGHIMGKLGMSVDSVAAALFRAYIYRPSRLEALVELCSVLRKNGKCEQSYNLSQVDPKPTSDILFSQPRCQWRILEEHALAAYKLGKHSEAQEYFHKIAAYPLSENDHVDQSLARYQVGDYEGSLSAARSAIAINPNLASAWTNMCAVYNTLGRFAEGKEAGEEALRLQPDFQLAQNNLKWSLSELAKSQSAG